VNLTSRAETRLTRGSSRHKNVGTTQAMGRKWQA
jgi:hypothetical protein